MAGRAEREVRRMGRQYSIVLRSSGALGFGVLALFVVPPAQVPVTVGVVAAVNLWVFGCARRRERRWVPAVDIGVVVAVCLVQSWTLPPPAVLHGSPNWVLAIASITVAAYQWHTAPGRGAAVTLVVTAAYLAGAAFAGTTSWVPPGLTACWLLVEAALSRGLLTLVLRGARAADRSAAETERVRRDAAVAAARRADEREQLAALHDTAAATMFAIGTGVVDGSEPWFADRVARDLGVLLGTDTAPGHVALDPLLAETCRHVPVAVDLVATGSVVIPTAPATALCRAVRAALANVAQHAGVDRAEVSVDRRAGAVVVQVTDRGRGFDPAAASPHARGISLSIKDRMAAVGGLATVATARGLGTRVRLEWPDA